MDIVSEVKKFVKFAVKEIGIEKMVNIKLTNSHDTIVTTAHYQPGVEIMIYVKNRAMVDVFRSVAHEMQHHRQFEEGRLIGQIQDIGGEIEDEANAVAGILIKKYAKLGNRQMYVESKIKQGLLNETPDDFLFVDGKSYSSTDQNTFPFYYYYGVLYIGGEGNNHTNIGLDYELVDDCLSDDPTPEEEAEAEANDWGYCSDIAGDMTVSTETQFNGRVFTEPKVISFWDDITKEDLDMVINDLNAEGGFGIDDNWYINYLDDDDKLVTIGEYLGHVSSEETLMKLKQIRDKHINGPKNRGGEKPIELSPTSSADRYKIKQMMRNPKFNIKLNEAVMNREKIKQRLNENLLAFNFRTNI